MSEAYDDNLILAYMEGDLAPAAEQDFKLALMKDPKLRRLVEQMAVDRAALRDMPDEEPPPDLMEGIDLHLERQMLLASDAPAGPIETDGDHRRFKLVRIGSFAALAAMLLLGAGLIFQTFKDMETPPQVASETQMQRDMDELTDQPLVLAPREALRREMTARENAARQQRADAIEQNADDAPAAMSMRSIATDTAEPAPAAAPEAMAQAPPQPTAPPMADNAATVAGFAEAPAAQPMATVVVADGENETAQAKSDGILETTINDADENRVASMPPATEPSGIVGGLGMVHMPAGSAPPGMPTMPPGSVASVAPSQQAMFGIDTPRPAQSPRNLAIIATAHEPTKAYHKLLEWCEVHNAAIRFDTRRNNDVDDVAELFRSGERKRVAVTCDVDDFPQLLSLFQGSPRIDASLVREPRGLRNRSMDAIDFADLVDRATAVDPATLQLPPNGSVTVQVVIRAPSAPHSAVPLPAPAERD